MLQRKLWGNERPSNRDEKARSVNFGLLIGLYFLTDWRCALRYSLCFISLYREYSNHSPELSSGLRGNYLLRSSACSDRNAATPVGDASIPALPSSHCAGQTSPFFSWKFSASTMRNISSMLRPSGRSLTTW